MYYIFQEMFVCGVLFFLLVTNGKSRWHSGGQLRQATKQPDN